MKVGDLVKQTGFDGVGIIVKIDQHGIGVQWNEQFCFVPVTINGWLDVSPVNVTLADPPLAIAEPKKTPS